MATSAWAVELSELPLASVGELLTLQRAAYVTEAQLYDDLQLPALVQTIDELRAELATATCLAARIGPRLVGSVRAREQSGLLHIGRLVVAPDLQGQGIGSALLAAIEATTQLSTATLFTGHLSLANIRLYVRHGYAETHRETLRAGLTLVHLAKTLTA